MADLQTLIPAMEQELSESSELYRPAHFWQRLGRLHEAQLDEHGFAAFKRTVNQSYYNWGLGIRNPQVRALATWWVRHPKLAVLMARLEDWQDYENQRRVNPLRSRSRRWLYARAIATLWEFARQSDPLGLLDHLEEPDLGRPVIVRHRGRRISQDLANSTIELYAIAQATGHPEPGTNGVIELGAGYGRLAWLYLSAFPKTRYLVADIPPALAIAQAYLSRLFPDRPIFGFRHFGRYEDVAGEFEAAQLAFVTPNQLELLPDQRAALTINISSLHEMRPDQIANYIELIGRHTAGVFYSKQWWQWTNPDDGVTITQGDYPIPATWKQIFLRSHPIHRQLFEAAYRIPVGA